MDEVLELDFIKEFVEDSPFDMEVCRDQLRSLWTAYCLHFDLDPDTYLYDNALRQVWKSICDGGEESTADWSDFDSFENFMCVYLV